MTSEAELDIVDLEWDEQNETHAGSHGVTPALVATMVTRAPKLFANREARTGTHMLIGPDGDGRFWTVILLSLGSGRWRPITGWPSTNHEIRLLKQEG